MRSTTVKYAPLRGGAIAPDELAKPLTPCKTFSETYSRHSTQHLARRGYLSANCARGQYGGVFENNGDRTRAPWRDRPKLSPTKLCPLVTGLSR